MSGLFYIGVDMSFEEKNQWALGLVTAVMYCDSMEFVMPPGP